MSFRPLSPDSEMKEGEKTLAKISLQQTSSSSSIAADASHPDRCLFLSGGDAEGRNTEDTGQKHPISLDQPEILSASSKHRITAAWHVLMRFR